jgi:adenylosuccinate synthase
MVSGNTVFNRIILLSGPISSGKSTLAKGLAARCRMSIFKTSEVLVSRIRRDQRHDRKVLQAEGERLDRRTKGRWVLEELRERLSPLAANSDVIVDSVRISEQIQAIREAYCPKVIHVHLTAPEDELSHRFDSRKKQGREQDFSYSEIRQNPTEKQVEKLAAVADIVIDTKRCTEQDVLIRTMSHLKVRTGKGKGFVDVVVGGQYGSEGKGQVVAYLATEYDLLVRVGGPNAGHTVFEVHEPYAHHQLPSGTRKSEAQLLIGPGAVLRVDKLLKEIADCRVDSQRLCIDGNAMIITDDDIRAEAELVKKIGSTGQGVGAATARRIMLRDKDTLLAKHIPELRPYIGSAFEVLENAYSRDSRVLLEGTQGTGLSLYHGIYPYVTSRDTTTLGCLAEAGIPPNRVRRVIMVCRTYPIRVESPDKETSGPLRDVSWEEIARRSGYRADKLRKSEKTTTTKRRRRIGEFEWVLLQRAALLNGATDVALTFTDYIRKENVKAKRFEQLTPETINFIQEVERVASAPVSLISTGFNSRSIIDRRSW